MRKRRHDLLQRLTTIACIVVGMILLVGAVSAFFVPGIEAALTNPPAFKVPPATQAPRAIKTATPARITTAETPQAVGTRPATMPVVAAANLVAADTFQRTDQQFWGTASDGQRWAGDAQVSPSFSIAGGAGQIAQGQGIYQAVLGPAVSNAEVLFKGSLSHFAQSNLGAVLRWTDPNNWYKAYINGTQLVLIKNAAGKMTRLSTVAFTAQDGQSYMMRFRVTGSSLMAKVWPAGQAEPTTWMVTATDTALASGFGGVRLVLQNGVVARITMFTETRV